jgi:hypothetical protein
MLGIILDRGFESLFTRWTGLPLFCGQSLILEPDSLGITGLGSERE